MFVEKPRNFGVIGIGARIASALIWRLVCLCALGAGGFLTSACLVTDTIELPTDPASPPVIFCPTYTVGATILFNAQDSAELRLPLQLRYEKLDETLAVRYRIDSRVLPDPRPQPDFECPEKTLIQPTGSLIRSDWTLAIPGARFPRGSCSRLTIVASSSFASCFDFDQTKTPEDDEGHRARAVFWIWEISGDALSNPDSASRLAGSCPAVNYLSTMEK